MRHIRFHLSTAVVLMFAAGVLLGVNLVGQPPPPLYVPDYKPDPSDHVATGQMYGWPSTWYNNNNIVAGKGVFAFR